MNNDYNNNNQQPYQQQQQSYQQPYQQPPYQQQQPYQQQPYQQPYQQQPYQQPPYQQPYSYQSPYPNPYQNQDMESKATQSMVFGIIGIFFAGLIFGILAITSANTCKKAGYTNGKVTAGFILGILDVSLITLGYLLIFIAALAG
ncbi:MAG: hypothetical protein NC228_09900 [[Eubacterium] siraeum]|nr:hypothetical protein [[Eubacterium] siraeum]